MQETSQRIVVTKFPPPGVRTQSAPVLKQLTGIFLPSRLQLPLLGYKAEFLFRQDLTELKNQLLVCHEALKFGLKLLWLFPLSQSSLKGLV